MKKSIFIIFLCIISFSVNAKMMNSPYFNINLPDYLDDYSEMYANLMGLPENDVALLTNGDDFQLFVVIMPNLTGGNLREVTNKYIAESPGTRVLEEESDMINKCVMLKNNGVTLSYNVVLMDRSQKHVALIILACSVLCEDEATRIINNYLQSANVK